MNRRGLYSIRLNLK
jgi:hypothetical protein